MNKIIKEKVKRSITWIIVIICLAIVASITIKYQFIGETNLAFKPSEMLVISTCDGTQNEDNPDGYKFNVDILQYNDIYIQFNKISTNEKDMIKSVAIENITYSGNAIDKANGNYFKAYMPSADQNKKFEYTDNYEIKSSLTYNGGNEDNEKALTISSQGGNILFRVVNFNIGKAQSNNDSITYDGKLLSDANINLDDLKFTLKFDIVLTLSNNISYRSNVSVDLPCGNIIEEGTSKYHNTDLSNLIFKRD